MKLCNSEMMREIDNYAIKSKTALFDEIAALIKANHSYEVPEIVQIPITCGSGIDEVRDDCKSMGFK